MFSNFKFHSINSENGYNSIQNTSLLCLDKSSSKQKYFSFIYF